MSERYIPQTYPLFLVGRFTAGGTPCFGRIIGWDIDLGVARPIVTGDGIAGVVQWSDGRFWVVNSAEQAARYLETTPA